MLWPFTSSYQNSLKTYKRAKAWLDVAHIDTHPFKQLLSVSACVSVCKTDRPLRVSRGLKPFYKNFINVSVVCEAVHKTDVERKVAKKNTNNKNNRKIRKKKNRNIFKLICDFVVGNRIDISLLNSPTSYRIVPCVFLSDFKVFNSKRIDLVSFECRNIQI